MRKELIYVSIGLAAVQFPIGSAHGQTGCPSDLSTLQGGEVYFYNAGQFSPLTSASPLEGKTRARLHLFYIVSSASSNRSGVIVIKTARYGAPLKEDVSGPDRVRLERREGGNACAPRKRPFSGSVSVEAYHEYHDLGQDRGQYLGSSSNAGALRTLRKFHTAYEAQAVGDALRCRQTDTKLAPDGSYEARSNRSQFSFDSNIVDNGFHSAVYNITVNYVSWGVELVLPSAQAQPNQLRERYVEIKSYHTAKGTACVPFTIEVGAPMQMLRVNDLEARDQNSQRLSEYRVGIGSER